MDSDPAGALGNQSAEQDLCPHSKKVKPLKNRRVLLVDAACRIDTLCNLIDVDPDFLYLRCHGFYVAMVCLNEMCIRDRL